MHTLDKIRFMNGNGIKLLAAALMLVDHVGFMFFPDLLVLRYIGRAAMPLFAFMVAEGCRYTKNKVKHFLLMFLLGVACQIVYFIADNGSLYMSILITFSLSVLAIYALQYFKRCLFGKQFKIADKILSALMLCAVVFIIWELNAVHSVNGSEFEIDYGFWGCMLPVFAALFDFRNIPVPEKFTKAFAIADFYYVRLAAFTVGLALLCAFTSGLNEWYAFFALIPLALYGEKKGKLPLKYFFYVFYPAHLVLLYAIDMLV